MGKIVIPAGELEEVSIADTTEQATSSQSGNTVDRGSLKKVARFFVELLLFATVVYLALWGYGLQAKNQDLQKQVNTLNANPVVAEQRKTNELVSRVATLTQLPTNEAPQAALVSDAEALKKQYAFFTDVQNGDQVLFYVKAGKVIVYRPSINKVVQTGPLSVDPAKKDKE